MHNYVGITIEKLMMLEELRGTKVLAGREGLSRRITKVNVMEVPDIDNWVSEGEFLVTTAYSIKDNIEILMDLIPKLNEKGVSGLGIKVGRYVRELPEDIIKLADKLDFPIIELPFCVSHTEVISCVLTEVVNDQLKLLINIDNFNRELMDIMISGGTLKEIARKLYDNVGNTLAIYENLNGSLEILCEHKYINQIEKLLKNQMELKLEQDSYLRKVGVYKYYLDDIEGRLVERVVIPIVIENIEHGFICIWLDNKQLTPLHHMMIESYVHIIALDVMEKLSIWKMENNYKGEFIDDLLSGNKERYERAVERAKKFNFHKNLKYSVITVLVKDNLKEGSSQSNKPKFNSEFISYLLILVEKMIKAYSNRSLYVDKDDRIIIVYGSESHKDKGVIIRETTEFCRKLANEASITFPEEKIVIGIGRAYNIDLIHKSFGQSRLIVENLVKKTLGSIIHYEELGLFRILCNESIQSDLAEFCSDVVGPLIQYDKNNKTELLRTLKTYFECDGNMKKLSEKMYVHYNTVIYRLDKIKEILSVDLENNDVRVDLQVALKAMDAGVINFRPPID